MREFRKYEDARNYIDNFPDSETKEMKNDQNETNKFYKEIILKTETDKNKKRGGLSIL